MTKNPSASRAFTNPAAATKGIRGGPPRPPGPTPDPPQPRPQPQPQGAGQ